MKIKIDHGTKFKIEVELRLKGLRNQSFTYKTQDLAASFKDRENYLDRCFWLGLLRKIGQGLMIIRGVSALSSLQPGIGGIIS